MRMLRPLTWLLILWALACRTANAQEWQVRASQPLAWAAARVQQVNRDALAAALTRAGLEAPAIVHITLVADEDARASRWPRWIVGFADPPDHVVIFPERSTRYPYESLESIVRHEVAHLALDRRAQGRPLPRWFHEGVAVSIEAGFGFIDEARLLTAMISQPAIGDVGRLFAAGTEPESARAYLLATALVADIRNRHGAQVVGAIAGSVGNGVAFDRAFADATGETVDTATAAAWERYLRWTQWLLAVDSVASIWTLVLLLAGVAFFVQRRRRAARRKQWDEEDADDPPESSTPFTNSEQG